MAERGRKWQNVAIVIPHRKVLTRRFGHEFWASSNFRILGALFPGRENLSPNQATKSSGFGSVGGVGRGWAGLGLPRNLRAVLHELCSHIVGNFRQPPGVLTYDHPRAAQRKQKRLGFFWKRVGDSRKRKRKKMQDGTVHQPLLKQCFCYFCQVFLPEYADLRLHT